MCRWLEVSTFYFTHAGMFSTLFEDMFLEEYTYIFSIAFFLFEKIFFFNICSTWYYNITSQNLEESNLISYFFACSAYNAKLFCFLYH